LKSSDAHLTEVFQWAKTQAMAYVFSGDPVGDWYEASLPGRYAFCMRDVSHQSLGAQVLGLSSYTQNMLYHFAQNISERKDWCSYWEITRDNQPAPVDYKNDSDFWYNLPASFDVLDDCYRMFLWTRSREYVDDPVFLHFYQRTVTSYVERWQLERERVMERPRILNQRLPAAQTAIRPSSRGIPTYDESSETTVLGVDLLAAQYAAYASFSAMEQIRGNIDEARLYAGKAQALKAFINQKWWNSKENRYYAYLDQSHQLRGHAGADLLYWNAVETPHIQGAIDDILDDIQHGRPDAVELQSHYAEILYRYGMPDAAYKEMLKLASPTQVRREYPEVSYAVIGAIVNGLMGIEPEAVTNASQPVIVDTLPQLTPQTQWVEVQHVQIAGSHITVRQEGNNRTELTEEDGPPLAWRPEFLGSYPYLIVNGKRMAAQKGRDRAGRTISFVHLTATVGAVLSAQAPLSH
jgi:hypothetical protein